MVYACRTVLVYSTRMSMPFLFYCAVQPRHQAQGAVNTDPCIKATTCQHSDMCCSKHGKIWVSIKEIMTVIFPGKRISITSCTVVVSGVCWSQFVLAYKRQLLNFQEFCELLNLAIIRY